jgi:ankyrin repeat protein
MVGKNVDLDINKSDRLGRTALHWAVDMGYPDVVQALLDYGAKPTAPDGIGRYSRGYLGVLRGT